MSTYKKLTDGIGGVSSGFLRGLAWGVVDEV